MDLNRQIYGRYIPEEWHEYCWMSQVRIGETPGEWKERIWERLMYFRENALLPSQSKKYLEARKLIRFPDGSSYAPEIRIAICFSCDCYTSVQDLSQFWTETTEFWTECLGSGLR